MSEQTFTISQQLHTKALNAQAAELSRLRDLVREMREALMYYADYDTNTGHDGEYIIHLDGKRTMMDRGDIAEAAIAKADAILKESGEPVKYGCHYSPIGERPYDDCRLETARGDCVHAFDAHVATKESCQYWRPIK